MRNCETGAKYCIDELDFGTRKAADKLSVVLGCISCNLSSSEGAAEGTFDTGQIIKCDNGIARSSAYAIVDKLKLAGLLQYNIEQNPSTWPPTKRFSLTDTEEGQKLAAALLESEGVCPQETAED